MLLRIFAVLALSMGIAVELGGGTAVRGFAGNLGAAFSVALWALASFIKTEEGRR